jgi:hypothetical protein
MRRRTFHEVVIHMNFQVEWEATNLIQLLCFWALAIVLFLLKTQRFGDWILSPSSGGTYQLGSIDRANPYLQTPALSQDYVEKKGKALPVTGREGP